MKQFFVMTAFAATLMACDTTKTFSDVTADVNAEFALAKQLRDRCAATGDIDHCLAWQDFKRERSAENPLIDYDKALASLG